MIRGALLHFTLSVGVMTLLAGALIWSAVQWGYGRELSLKTARIEGLEREVSRAVQVGQKPNAQIRDETLDFVYELRRFIESAVQAMKAQGVVATASRAVFLGADAPPVELVLGFDRRFRVRAGLLRKDLLSRLSVSDRDEQATPKYEERTVSAMRAVADDLERLARRLGN